VIETCFKTDIISVLTAVRVASSSEEVG